MGAPIQQVEGVHVPEEAEAAETERVTSGMQTDVQLYHPRSPTGCTAGNLLDPDFNFFQLTDLYDTKELILSASTIPSVVIGSGSEPENTQVLCHALEPNTETQSLSSPITQKRKFAKISEGEGDSAQEVSHKVLHLSDPVALPITKGHMVQPRASASLSVSSKQVIELQMERQLLGSSSEKGDSIKIDPSSRVTTGVSLHILALTSEIPITQRGAHSEVELMTTTTLSSISR